MWARFAFTSLRPAMIEDFLSITYAGILASFHFAGFLFGALYGSTFIGLVALFLNLGGRLAGKNPVVLMGAMTAAYGIGQVGAPLYSVALIEYYGNYNATLHVTAFIVFIGIVFLFFAKKIETTNWLNYKINNFQELG